MADEATTTAPAPAATTTTTAPAAPPAVSTTGFDWKSVGVDDAGVNLVNERQWKGPSDLLKSYTNLEKLTGVPADRLIKLPKDNDPAAWNEVYTKLGRPETADKYVIPVPEGQDATFAATAKGWFHEAGIPQVAATKLAEKWNGFIAETQTKQAEAQAQRDTIQVKELQTAWGAKYDDNAKVVDRAAETFGMTQEQLTVLKSVLGPKAAMEFLYNIGSKVAVEDRAAHGMQQKGEFTLTPDAAKAKIAELKSSRSFAQLFQSTDPKQRMEAQAEMTRLHQIAYPGTTSYAAQGR